MNIVDYLEQDGADVPGGSGWRAMRCPYHTDRNKSASINRSAGKFFCFVCGINEDLIGLIRLREGLSYAEAQRKAGDGAGAGGDGVRAAPDLGGLLSPGSGNQPGSGGSSEAWRSGLA